MKVTNWCRKLSAAILAAGIWVPGLAYAQINVPLGDPGFEAFVVPAIGYAYADEYRPTSAWVDDLDSPSGYTQDDGASAWLYNGSYAENPANSRRASPRTGNQAMHGLANYSAQETTAVFEANRTYTFSLWAQDDEILDHPHGLFMYIFDGTVPFSDANSLQSALFEAIPQRTAGMTAEQSKSNWAQFSISHHVAPGAPEIGHPIGVGFFARRDTAVDDATLTSVIPEPGTMILVGMGGLALASYRRRRE
jgi:hypothetical protein